MEKHDSNSSYVALKWRKSWIKAGLQGSIDGPCAVHGNSFDANQKIHHLSFEADRMEAE